MAKPIRATPTLTGVDARRFVQRMIQRERSPISEQDRALARRIASLKIEERRS